MISAVNCPGNRVRYNLQPLGSSHHRLPPRLHLLELHQPRPPLRAQPHDLLHRAPSLQRGHLYRVIEGTLSWSYDTKKAVAVKTP